MLCGKVWGLAGLGWDALILTGITAKEAFWNFELFHQMLKACERLLKQLVVASWATATCAAGPI